MNALFIKGTHNTPEIDFQPAEYLFKISGRSIPDDCDIYYYPVIRYLETFSKNADCFPTNKTIHFEFNFIYYNSTTIRYLNTIMQNLQKIAETNKILVKWYYDDDDEFLEEAGKYFQELFPINIELIAKPVPPKNKKPNI